MNAAIRDSYVTPETLAAMNAEQAAADDALLAALFAPVTPTPAPLRTAARLLIDPQTFTLCTLERALILDALGSHIDRLARRGFVMESSPRAWREKNQAQIDQNDREQDRATTLFALLDSVTIRSGT